MRCLICGSELKDCLCPRCGFDLSTCRERFPTLVTDGQRLPAIWVLQDKQYKTKAAPESEATPSPQPPAGRPVSGPSAPTRPESEESRPVSPARDVREKAASAQPPTAKPLSSEPALRVVSPQKTPRKAWKLLIPLGGAALGLLLFFLLGQRQPKDYSSSSGSVPAATQTEARTEAPSLNQEEAQPQTLTPGIHTYIIYHVDNHHSWEDAQSLAIEYGGHLACFETKEELDYVIQFITQLNSGRYYLHIGGRRDPNGTDYHWVDYENEFVGESLDPHTGWYEEAWKAGEPSLEWNGVQETVMVLSYDWDMEKWIWNDASNEISQNLDRETVGFLVEFE